MKRLRHFGVVTILIFTLTLSTFAGDMHCGAVAPPPEQTSSVTGDMATGDTATNETPSTETAFVDPVTGLALSILKSLLSLF